MIYDYKCKSCGKEYESFNRVETRASSECPHCGGIGIKQLTLGFAAHVFKPYMDDMMLSHPVYIESRRQKARLLKQNNLEQL